MIKTAETQYSDWNVLDIAEPQQENIAITNTKLKVRIRPGTAKMGAPHKKLYYAHDCNQKANLVIKAQLSYLQNRTWSQHCGEAIH